MRHFMGAIAALVSGSLTRVLVATRSCRTTTVLAPRMALAIRPRSTLEFRREPPTLLLPAGRHQVRAQLAPGQAVQRREDLQEEPLAELAGCLLRRRFQRHPEILIVEVVS